MFAKSSVHYPPAPPIVFGTRLATAMLSLFPLVSAMLLLASSLCRREDLTYCAVETRHNVFASQFILFVQTTTRSFFGAVHMHGPGLRADHPHERAPA